MIEQNNYIMQPGKNYNSKPQRQTDEFTEIRGTHSVDNINEMTSTKRTKIYYHGIVRSTKLILNCNF